MRINVDPEADASGFGYVEAGQYRLRVKACTYKDGKQYPYLNWEFEFVDPNIRSTDGKSRPGNVFDITTLKKDNNAQFRLRQIVEGLGLNWEDFDTERTIGQEIDVQLGVKEYQGTLSNNIVKILSKK